MAASAPVCGAMLVAFAAACAAAPPPLPLPPMPGAGGPAWTELTSEHFTMWTDSSVARGHQLLREMEHLRQVVLGVAFSQIEAGGKTLVIAFRNAAEVGAFVPREFVASAWGGRGGIAQPMIVIDANADREDRRIVTHELIHVISYSAIGEQPSWFAEGLAGFFETVNLDADQSMIAVGKPLPDMMQRLHDDPPLPMAEVFSCSQPACMNDRFYATTWALYSYLINVHPAELLRYQARLAELPRREIHGAWAEVFPQLTAARLDHEVRAWIAHGPHQVWHYTVKIREPHITTRSIGDGEVQAARGVLRAYNDRGNPAEPPEIGLAIAIDPANLLAYLIRAWKTQTVDPGAAQRIVAAHPDDWRAWMLLGYAASTRDDAEAATARACRLAPNPALLPPSYCAAPPSPPLPR